MHSWIELNRSSIEHNYKSLAALTGTHSVFAPVLKSNAYGHGIEQMYRGIAKFEPSWICINYLSEADKLRQFGYSGRVLVVGPILPSELHWAKKLSADILIPSHDLLKSFLDLNDSQRPLAHVKIDTGMSRQGFLAHEVSSVADSLKSVSANVVGICTHFANVEDVMDQGYAELQHQRFVDACQVFQERGYYKLIRHAASSASTLIFDRSQLDMCRVGVSVYGVWPSQPTKLSYNQQGSGALELRPVLSWRTRVALVKDVAKGDFIGYGCTYRAPQNMRVAVLPVGYFEGYPRLAGDNQSFVLIRGGRCQIVGRICMNMMMVDVTHVLDAKHGDEVVLIGHDGRDGVTASDLANWSQSIHYEVLTRLNENIPRNLT